MKSMKYMMLTFQVACLLFMVGTANAQTDKIQTIPTLNFRIAEVIADPTQPSTLYVGTLGGGVYKSMDGGQSWVLINNGLTNLVINAIAIDPQDSTTVSVHTPGGDFLSTDAGESWSETDGVWYPCGCGMLCAPWANCCCNGVSWVCQTEPCNPDAPACFIELC